MDRRLIAQPHSLGWKRTADCPTSISGCVRLDNVSGRGRLKRDCWDTSFRWAHNSRGDRITGHGKGISLEGRSTLTLKWSLRRINIGEKQNMYRGVKAWQDAKSPVTCQRRRAQSSLSGLGRWRPIPGRVNQSPEMERWRWDEGWLLEIYDKTMPEITMETGATSAGCLAGRCLSMEDVIDVRIYETSRRCKWATTGAKNLVKTLVAVAKPKGATFHW